MSADFTNTKEKKVHLIQFSPEFSQGVPLDLEMGWHDPLELVAGFITNIHKASRRTYRYEIVKHDIIQDVTPLLGDFKYPIPDLISVSTGAKEPRVPMGFDYKWLIEEFNVIKNVSSRVIDEVWVMGYPYAGLFEAVMGGPNPLYLTGPALKDTEESLRRFVIMGFNCGEDQGAMLEAFIHRAEACMSHVYDKYPDNMNMWKAFSSQEAVGTAHRAPNSTKDFDWNNKRYVQSTCEDWLTYPDLTGRTTTVNCSNWGFGSRILHHLWWLKHLPNRVEKTKGIFNNWWHYVMTPDWIAQS